MKKMKAFTLAEVPEAQQYRSHQELSIMAKEPAEPRHLYRHSEDCIISSCHPELVSGSCNSDDEKILNQVQNDKLPEPRHLYRHSEDVCPKNLVHNNKILRFAQDAEVVEQQQSPCHPELLEAGQNSEDCIISSCHPELVSGSYTEKMLKQVQHDKKQAAFTLAEVLITLGIIGVVAAITIPTLMKNIQDRVLTAQVRTAKYKLTLATDKIKSLGLIEAYPTTADFIGELSKHFKIAKVCDNDHLRECWTSDTISVPNTSGTFQEVNVSTLKNGTNIKALGLGTASTKTMGMITGDGVSMILTYSPVCQALDFATTYSWSTEDGKPVTNATTNCISAIFDVNGATGPNRIGKDVRTLNSLFGSVQFSATSVDLDGCKALKSQGLVKDCYYNTDYYAGAVKKCNDLGLHLPDPQTLAVIAGAKYGRTDIGTYTLIMSDAWAKTQTCGDHTCTSCTDYYNSHNYSSRVQRADKIVCTPSSIPNGANSSVSSLSGNFWSSSETSKSTAFKRNIYPNYSSWNEYGRDNHYGIPLCVGD